MNAKKYHEIITDTWQVFKKYLAEDANLDTFTDDIHKLDQKYHEANDLTAYRFMQAIMKVFFDELARVKS